MFFRFSFVGPIVDEWDVRRALMNTSTLWLLFCVSILRMASVLLQQHGKDVWSTMSIAR